MAVYFNANFVTKEFSDDQLTEKQISQISDWLQEIGQARISNIKQLKEVLNTITTVNKNVNWREIFFQAYFDSLKRTEELDAFP